MDKIRAQDLPTGVNGTGYMNINGSIVEAFKLKKVAAKYEMTVQSQLFLGSNIEEAAARGSKITGDISFYNTSSKLKSAMRSYQNGGSYPDITIQYYSETSALGREEITLTGVILATVPLGGLDDSSSDATVQESSFTANHFDMPSKFKE